MDSLKRIFVANLRIVKSFGLACFVSLAIQSPALAQIDEVIVTANKRAENIQDISASITALTSEAIERAGIQDITRLETLVPGLRIGYSGGEVRPALRGARTNEVGVAGPGIAEQVVGIFQDGIYVPTTTAGMGAYVDVARIEVLRGPQGTLYGRNTFAGTVNVITNEPNFDEFSGTAKVTIGDYRRTAAEAVVNFPISDNMALRIVAASDAHDGLINNLQVPGASDDLKEKNQQFARATLKWEGNNGFEGLFRYEWSTKDANSDAIWGYQQIAGYVDGVATPGHIYSQFGISRRQPDPGPYDVYRNAVSWDEQETNSLTLRLTKEFDFAEVRWTTNYSKLSGSQFYDSDYSPGGNQTNTRSGDFVDGFGRQDDHETWSSELQFTSTNDGPVSWVGGIYWFSQEADWEWLSSTNLNLDNDPETSTADSIVVPQSWGNPDDDPHTVDSLAVYGQATFAISDTTRLIGGLRWNDDEKSFTVGTRPIPDWDDSAVLWKAAAEFDISDDAMIYASASTGYRTGGANDWRVVARGADPLYDNEEVTSYEVGLKSTLMDGTMIFNVAAFVNEYEDVKAQLFAFSCPDPALVIPNCGVDEDGVAINPLTFEYYQNGGDSSTQGLEVDIQYAPDDKWLINGSFAWIDSEFDDGFVIGSSLIGPLIGLGNYQGRANGNLFDFSGWRPALSPEFTLSFNASYVIDLANGSTLTPYLQTTWVDDYYTFDVNIPETLQDSHTKTDIRLTWRNADGDIAIEGFVLNAEDEEVLARTVVHSQLRRADNVLLNSVQANYANPRTWGLSLRANF